MAFLDGYPHACGEHGLEPMRMPVISGSSPRMWGTQLLCKFPYNPIRFIPTHVGNTPLWGFYNPERSVHPHACGEHSTVVTYPDPAAGSSPRMWGTRTKWTGIPRKWRFIPTHVGNTASGAGSSLFGAVHPHACGEHKGRSN